MEVNADRGEASYRRWMNRRARLIHARHSVLVKMSEVQGRGSGDSEAGAGGQSGAGVRGSVHESR